MSPMSSKNIPANDLKRREKIQAIVKPNHAAAPSPGRCVRLARRDKERPELKRQVQTGSRWLITTAATKRSL
jgi:hypothetical protein